MSSQLAVQHISCARKFPCVSRTLNVSGTRGQREGGGVVKREADYNISYENFGFKILHYLTWPKWLAQKKIIVAPWFIGISETYFGSATSELQA